MIFSSFLLIFEHGYYELYYILSVFFFKKKEDFGWSEELTRLREDNFWDKFGEAGMTPGGRTHTQKVNSFPDPPGVSSPNPWLVPWLRVG